MKIVDDRESVKILVEGLILSSEEPLSNQQLKKVLDSKGIETPLKNVLDSIKESWQGKMVELVQVASGWRFQSKKEVQDAMNLVKPVKPPKYSRAVMETLAIIAYKQPVTRGDIEDIRSVSVSANILRLLEARGWIETIGFRETPGRPALLATTKDFLNDLGLKGIHELPPLENVDSLIETVAMKEEQSDRLELQKELDIS